MADIHDQNGVVTLAGGFENTPTAAGTSDAQSEAELIRALVAQRKAAAQGQALPHAPNSGIGRVSGAFDSPDSRDALIELVNEMHAVLINVGLMKGPA
jgi:hypothetical protein